MPVGTVAIPTCGRSERLRACVTTHLEHARRHDRELQFVVVDDSEPASAEHNRAALDRIRRSLGVRVQYLGIEERARFVATLIEAGAPADQARCALERAANAETSAGAARNVALLALAGRRFVASDDDMRCEIEGLAEPRAPRMHHLPQDPTEFHFYTDPAELPEPNAALDLFAAYDQMLDSGSKQHPVRCAMAGVRGGSGMGIAAARLFVRGRSRERLFDRYPDSAVTGCIRRCVPEPTLLDAPFGMAGHLALDNTIPLPPFAPTHRNQDGVFFALRCRLMPQARSALVPLTLRHQTAAALSNAQLVSSCFALRPNDFVSAAIMHTPVTAAAHTLEDRYRSLAAALKRLARSASFPDQVVAWWRASRSFWIGEAERALAESTAAPSAWIRDVRSVRDAWLQSRRDTEICVRSAPLLRQRMSELAEILQAWPELCAAASRVAT